MGYIFRANWGFWAGFGPPPSMYYYYYYYYYYYTQKTPIRNYILIQWLSGGFSGQGNDRLHQKTMMAKTLKPGIGETCRKAYTSPYCGGFIPKYALCALCEGGQCVIFQGVERCAYILKTLNTGLSSTIRALLNVIFITCDDLCNGTKYRLFARIGE
jgi:hypothetical protein